MVRQKQQLRSTLTTPRILCGVAACGLTAACLMLLPTGCARDGLEDGQRLDDFFILRHPDLAAGEAVVATTRLRCDRPVQGELRLGSRWGVDLWLDGRRLDSERRRRSRQTALDQCRLPILLSAGRHELVVRFLNGDTPSLDDERVVLGDPGCVLRFADAGGRALAGLALDAPGGVPGRDTWSLASGRRGGRADGRQAPANDAGTGGSSSASDRQGWRGITDPAPELDAAGELCATPLRPYPLDPVPVVFYLDEVRDYPILATVRRTPDRALIDLDWTNVFDDSIEGYRIERTARWHQQMPFAWTHVATTTGNHTYAEAIALEPEAWPWNLGTGMGRIITYRITPEPPRSLDWTTPRIISALVLAPGFHGMEEVNEALTTAAREHPEIVSLEELGRSAWGQHPIIAARLSGPTAPEPAADADASAIAAPAAPAAATPPPAAMTGSGDKPAVLVVGNIHAREPFGIEISVDLVQNLSRDYGRDPGVTELLDATELWVIPVLNSGGWSMISSGYHGYFRKNVSDQNGDGAITPGPLYPVEWAGEPLLNRIHDALYLEGVDLNRNFAPYWDERIGDSAGSPAPGLHKYRGPAPFSEPESRALRDLALREGFVFSLIYHEPGEKFYFHRDTADDDLFEQVASQLGRAKRKTAGEWSGCTLGFMYHEAGTIDFTVEGATHARGDAEWLLAPAAGARDSVSAHHQAIVQELLRLAASTGIHGRVVEVGSGRPLEARLEIYVPDETTPRRRFRTDAGGNFHRHLLPGTYVVRALREPEGAGDGRTFSVVADRPAQVVMRLGTSHVAD